MRKAAPGGMRPSRRNASDRHRPTTKRHAPIASVAALSERLAGCSFGGTITDRTNLVGDGVLDVP